MKGATAGLSGLAALVLLLPMEATGPVCIGANLLAERGPALAGLTESGDASTRTPGGTQTPGDAQTLPDPQRPADAPSAPKSVTG
jgi:hypothetical protein